MGRLVHRKGSHISKTTGAPGEGSPGEGDGPRRAVHGEEPTIPFFLFCLLLGCVPLFLVVFWGVSVFQVKAKLGMWSGPLPSGAPAAPREHTNRRPKMRDALQNRTRKSGTHTSRRPDKTGNTPEEGRTGEGHLAPGTGNNSTFFSTQHLTNSSSEMVTVDLYLACSI